MIITIKERFGLHWIVNLPNGIDTETGWTQFVVGAKLFMDEDTNELVKVILPNGEEHDYTITDDLGIEHRVMLDWFHIMEMKKEGKLSYEWEDELPF